MKREAATNWAAGTLRARAKLFEYSDSEVAPLPLPHEFSASKLFPITIGFLGDYAAELNSAFVGAVGYTDTARSDVEFSAKTFLAYANSQIDEGFRSELFLLSAAAFRLIEMPGISIVQAGKFVKSNPNAEYIDQVLSWSLLQPWASHPPASDEKIELYELARSLFEHYRNGVSKAHLSGCIKRLRAQSYAMYGDRELLLADLISAVVTSRFNSSTRLLLHDFSKTTAESWRYYLSAGSAVHELWPSQIRLGESGVLSGSSAIVQMPTSAGKTKATELILRTAFAGRRARLAAIVAPFVALCDEIHNELQRALSFDQVRVNRLGDALQADYEKAFLNEGDEEDEAKPNVVVMTPEKLLYVLRHHPHIANFLDLVIYDEGHQFDSGARGVTYELLLTSIKNRLRRNTQTVLISAVIQNSNVVSDWLLEARSRVVVDTALQTQRSIGFTSKHSDGQVNFLPSSDSEPAFAVPGVMPQVALSRRPRENPRLFPDYSDSKSVALHLGLRLFSKGGVAVFCGKKDSVSSFMEHALDSYRRDLAMAPPSTLSDEEEVRRLVYLSTSHFGEGCYLTQGAKLGIYTHTSGTPRGLRLAIEHAMRKRLICFVVCTSTLAQGVNLPIKYLLITGTQQGKEPIRIRDFKNLMGRAGRAGMYDEGAIIFCDTKLSDERGTRTAQRKRAFALSLIDPNSEDPIGSSLLSLILPFKDRYGNPIDGLPQVEICIYLISGPGRVNAIIEGIGEDISNYGVDEADLRSQFDFRLDLLKRLQSYVMASSENADRSFEAGAEVLAKETLAYHLATASQKDELIRLFKEIAAGIVTSVPDEQDRARFGRNLLGVQASLLVDRWIATEITGVLACQDRSALARKLWPLLMLACNPSRFMRCEPPSALESTLYSWIDGASYKSILDSMMESAATYPWGSRRRSYDIDDVIALCDDLFGFEFPLVLSAVRDSINKHGEHLAGARRVLYLLDLLQKQVKYGLPNAGCVALFEAGFSDREVAQRIEYKIWATFDDPDSVAAAIRDWQADVEDILFDYPSYFRSVFLSMIVQPDKQ